MKTLSKTRLNSLGASERYTLEGTGRGISVCKVVDSSSCGIIALMERIKRVGKVDGGSFEIFGGKKYTTVAK